MGSINEELKENQSRSNSIYSEAHENSIEVGNRKSFLKLSYIFNFSKKKAKIGFSLTKFSICNNFDTLLRISKFGKSYGDLYGKVNQKMTEFRISIRNSKIQSESKIIQTNNTDKNPFNQLVKKVSNAEDQVNKKFFSKVKQKMINRKLIKLNQIPEFNNEIKKELHVNHERENDIIVLKPNVQKVNYINKMKLSFDMNQIEFLFPLDFNQSSTKVFKFNYNIKLKMNSSEESECLYDDDQLIKQDYKKVRL